MAAASGSHYFCITSSPLGDIKIVADENHISTITFLDDNVETILPATPLLQNAVSELASYFEGSLQQFTFPITQAGSEFQQSVWQQLLHIPFGKTINYLQLANQLGDPKVIRAAASANGKNNIAIVVPCHRVIGSDGSLTGYAGGLHRKQWLLDHERKCSKLSFQPSLFG